MPAHSASHEAYRQAVEFLNGLQVFGARFGLETTLNLAAHFGNPQQQLRFIHVAGTNGKGSTCAMLESIYRTAGLRVGLFTSPHLVSFRERIQVNRELISKADVVRLVEEIKSSRGKFAADQHPTFFEVVTMMALNYFAEQKCELIIWETGLGGRLDATNIVTPLASVITNIGFDHQQWLGDTLEKIAAEKAGIIKPGVPVVTATTDEALCVIEKIAREQNASLTVVTADSRFTIHDSLALPGEHQRLNAALAAATVEVLQVKINVSEKQICAGLAEVNWPGRMQIVTRRSGRKILLDGAHNAEGAEVLRATLRTLKPEKIPTITIILGILADKNCREMCAVLAPLAANIFLVPVKSARTAAPAELAEICRAENPRAIVTAYASLHEALEQSRRDAFVVIAGSLYLIGEAMELLRLSRALDSDEKSLNEWKSASPINPGSEST